MGISENITFSGESFDRAAHLRGDRNAIQGLMAKNTCRVMVLWQGKLLIDFSKGTKIVWMQPNAEILAHASDDPIFLGLQNGAARFALDISGWTPNTQPVGPSFPDESRVHFPGLPDQFYFADLRSTMGELTNADAGDAATAKGIMEWHKIHKYCANCGAKSHVINAGWQRQCPECNRQHFPRTDPVVIMLVTHGNDVLIGRSHGWPEGMFSLLAGFMEPGETIFEAVRREVFEETGVRIGKVEYLNDQPWPFPSSLMIGCRAQALTKKIILDPVELESALWISREAVLASLDGSNPALLPARKGSIARFLLDRWLADTLD